MLHHRQDEIMTKRRILITGAGSGFGEGAALGLARAGHEVIATVEIPAQVRPLRDKAAAAQLTSLRVEKLDLLNAIDIEAALAWEFDVLFNNAAIGEGGPVSEIPLELVRKNYEVNVFGPLNLTQKVVRKWILAGRPGKVVFTTSEVALIVFPGIGAYASTKHALQAIAETLQQELRPFNIAVQTITPGPYATGFNQNIVEAAFKWLNDETNFTKRADLRAVLDSLPTIERDPAEVIEAMIRIVPSETGQFRNIIPAGDETELERQEDTVAHAAI
jgi:NAD(P)-dependent dehydrogenase (short-subunit alcohol dehydrogenase family)